MSEAHARRLPVYLLLDCSGSMSGEPIEAVRQGIRVLLAELRGDPQAIESVYLSVIAFSSSAMQLCPLTEVCAFQEPHLHAEGSTALGDALRLLNQCIETEVETPSLTRKGDWKPIVFLMTDGQPTDNWEEAADRIKQKKLDIIACAAGPEADESLLKQITEKVVRLDNIQPDTIGSYFKWVSGSIKTAADTTAPGDPDASIKLPPPPVIQGFEETQKLSPLAPEEKLDRVHFSVTSPSMVSPATPFLIKVWAHLEQDRQAVIRRAHEATKAEIFIESKGPFRILRGTFVSVRLSVEGLIIEYPEDVLLWEGEIGSAAFSVLVPPDTRKGPRRGLAVIRINDLEITRLYFIIEVGSEASPAQPISTREQRHRKAFASYASADRDEVLPRIQGIQKAGLEVFFDVFSLRSGQYWEQELWKEIPSKDIFYLFWSDNARKSTWVEKEWRCALQTRGLDFIDPVPLVSPEKVPPPPELATKHFNDWILAFMSAYKSTMQN
jgi:uncharacterized protein YegL